jgi:hypothetical protein
VLRHDDPLCPRVATDRLQGFTRAHEDSIAPLDESSSGFSQRPLGVQLIHAVRRKFDREVAYEQAITGMTRMLTSLSKSVEMQFEQGYGPVRRGLCDADMEDFLAKAREAAEVLGGSTSVSGRQGCP